MPYLRFHPEVETLSADSPIPISTGRIARSELHMTCTPARGTIAEVERAMDLVDNRLQNLRDLVDQFGLDDDDGPRAA